MYPTLQTGAHCVMALIILCTTVLIGTASNGQMLRPARAVYDLQLNKDRFHFQPSFRQPIILSRRSRSSWHY